MNLNKIGAKNVTVDSCLGGSLVQYSATEQKCTPILTYKLVLLAAVLVHKV
jgi:hypothetical protein